MYKGDLSLSGPREQRPDLRMPRAVDALDAGGNQGLIVSTPTASPQDLASKGIYPAAIPDTGVSSILQIKGQA